MQAEAILSSDEMRRPTPTDLDQAERAHGLMGSFETEPAGCGEPVTGATPLPHESGLLLWTSHESAHGIGYVLPPSPFCR